MKALALLVMVVALVRAQTELQPPRLGFLVDKDHSLRRVYGVPGSFQLGAVLAMDVVSVASSDSFAMLKSRSSLAVLDGAGATLASVDAPEGPALFSFGAAGQPAVAYLPDTGTLAVWKDGRLESQQVGAEVLAGSAVAVAVIALDRVRFVVERSDGLWQVDVDASGGTLRGQSALPGVSAPVLLPPGGGLLWSDGTALAIRAADGSEKRVEIGAAIGDLAALQTDWVRVSERSLQRGPMRRFASGSNRQFVVRLTPGREQVWQLPEETPCCGR